jgi:hypothetical protein
MLRQLRAVTVCCAAALEVADLRSCPFASDYAALLSVVARYMGLGCAPPCCNSFHRVATCCTVLQLVATHRTGSRHVSLCVAL